MIISLKKIRKIVAIILLIASVLLIGMMFIAKTQKPTEAVGKLYPDNNSRVAYLNLCGWKVDESNFIEEKSPFHINSMKLMKNTIKSNAYRALTSVIIKAPKQPNIHMI